ncbi:MAG TPA: hypothetical protein VGN99_11905 [Steroidobacteraceae bacterium]|jgi:hypothetical protein|nr:hypothetical protein [Steroidobacteraceae bacterium]
MNRRLSIIPAIVSLLITTATLIAVPALAEELKASFTPREMAHCMMKRFRANHSESYRDAYNACKAQFDLAQADRGETAMNETAPVETSTRQ